MANKNKFIKALWIFLFYTLNLTWGIIQTLIGFVLFLTQPRDCKKQAYFGSVCTFHKGKWGGVSLGIFIFVNGAQNENWTSTTMVHEYGHCVQSMILGPLYFLIVGIPSIIWCNAKRFAEIHREIKGYYFNFYPERWANHLGAKITGEPAPERIPFPDRKEENK